MPSTDSTYLNIVTTAFYSVTFCDPFQLTHRLSLRPSENYCFKIWKFKPACKTGEERFILGGWGPKRPEKKTSRREKMNARHHCFAWKSLVQTIALKGNFFILHLVTVRCWMERPDFPAAGMGGLRTNYRAARSKVAQCLGFCAVEKCADLLWFM